MKVDFPKVRQVPIASVFSLYKVEVRKRSNTELVANCPFPSHANASKEHKWTLAISTEKNRWYCHSDSCRAASNKPKGGDVIDVVAMMENLTPLDAAKRLSELFALTSNGEGRAAKENLTAKPEPEATGNKPLAFELKGIDPEHPYIQSRGISVETASAFGVGFFRGRGSMSGRIVFPLHENGTLIGYAGRLVDTGDPKQAHEPKWKLPLGLQRTFLYGLERCDPLKPLILCESCWGVLYFFQHGFQACAMLGSSLTDAQEKLLDPFAVIHLAMDNDEAGRAASIKIAERLKAKHKVFRAYLVE